MSCVVQRGRRMGVMVLMFLALTELVAQPVDTVYVRSHLPHRTFSRYFHWANAEYQWTVTGSGAFGQIAGSTELTADARFSLVSFVGLPQYPKLPLEDNGTAGTAFCTFFPAACRIYFATNARVDRDFTLEDMVLGDAEQMKVYRFIPDVDQYNPEHRYVRTVRGNDVKAQFLYVDRYGEAGNQYYLDNTAVFTIVIERKSPELLIIQPNPYRLLNDGPPNTIPSTVFREEILNFGQTPVGSGASVQFRRILKNRGLEILQIRQILVVGANQADFSVVRADGMPLTQSIQLRQWQDSVELVFQFQPTSEGVKSAEVLILCNDPTQTPTGNEYYFRFILQGEGTAARLDALSEIDFGDVWVGQQKDTILYVYSVGTAAIELPWYAGIQSPFFITDPRDTTQDPQPPPVLQPGMVDSVRLGFRPIQKGRAVDTLLIGGNNITPYPVVLRGRGMMAAAQIWHRWEFVDSLRDTIDFGRVSEGEQVVRSFTIRNLGNVPLIIPDKVIPYYEFVDIIPGSKDEFVELFQLGCDTCFVDTLTPYYDQIFRLLYDGTLTFPVGKKAARLRISVRQRDDTSKVVATKEFVLLAEKVPVRIIASDTLLDFDSVYVFRSSPPRTLFLKNLSSQYPITVDTVIITGSSVVAEFQSSISGSVEIQPSDSLPLSVRYRPVDRGSDVATITVYYFSVVSGIQRSDTLRIRVRGVGVEQQLRLITAFRGGIPPDPFPVRRGESIDTVDIGAVPVGQSRNIAVVVRNEGNVAVQRGNAFLYVLQEVTPSALFHYQVVTPHKPEFAVGHQDTIHLLYQPQSRGIHTVRYVLSSNLPERIATAPDSVRRWSFVVTGRGIQPQVEWSTDSIQFGQIVVLPDCPKGITVRVVRLTNTGDAPLRILAVRILPQTGAFAVQGSYDGTQVDPNGAFVDIAVRFIPPTIGSFTADLVVHTDETFPYKEYRIPLSGWGIPPPIVRAWVPSLIRVRPGHPVLLPVRWQPFSSASLLASMDTLQFALRYNRTLLEYRDYEVVGTTAENAEVKAVETGNGGDGDKQLLVQLIYPEPESVVLRDTLILLRFQTFLGSQKATEVVLNASRVVVEDCAGVVEILGEGGVVELDSICGLESKLMPVNGAYRFRLDPLAVNARRAFYEIPFGIEVSIELWTISGEKYWSWKKRHSAAGRFHITLPSLPSGLYFLRMRAGIFQQIQPVLIPQ